MSSQGPSKEERRVLNVGELEYVSSGRPGAPSGFDCKQAVIGARIGAKKLGYRMTVVPPLHKAWPRHSHLVNEEMFFILEGEGILRMGVEAGDDKKEKIRETPLKKGDFVCCPPGHTNADAHQIVNTSKDKDLMYLRVSTMEQPDICLYPDSNKFGGEDSFFALGSGTDEGRVGGKEGKRVCFCNCLYLTL